MDQIFDEEKVKIKFEGQTHQIDVNTLTSSLLVFSEALKEINVELHTGKNVDIKIEALSPGSFEVNAIISAINGNDLLNAIAIVGGVAAVGGKVMGTIVKTYTGIVKLRSWLKNSAESDIEKVIEEGGQTSIKTKNGGIYICSSVIYNTYKTSQSVNDAISDQFRILEEDSAIDGLTLSSEQESFSVEKSDFSTLAQKVEVSSENKRKELKENETLTIVKPVFEKSLTRRWEFIWRGNRISSNITDAPFLDKVERGEIRFGTGDTVKVDLQINQVLSPIYSAWMNESYQILMIHEHTPRKIGANVTLGL